MTMATMPSMMMTTTMRISYDIDPDYAAGVDDAMDELDW